MASKCKKCRKDLLNTNVISEVKPDSEAAKLGIQENDQIVAIDGNDIKEVKDTDKVLKPYLVHSVVIKRQGKDIVVDVESLKDFFEAITLKEKSVAVQNVKIDSIAAKLGISPEDEIIKVDAKKIATQEDIVKTYKTHNIIIKRQETEISHNVEDISVVINDLEFAEETVVVKNVKTDSDAAKLGLMAGDTILSIDSKKIEKQEDIQNVIKPKEYKITVLRNKQKKEFKTNDIRGILKSITLKPEEVCSACGAKQKKNFIPIIILILAICLVLVLIAVVLGSGKNNKTITDVISPIEEVSNNKELSSIESEILSPSVIEQLEKNLKDTIVKNEASSFESDSEETKNRKRSGSNRSEVFYAYDESGTMMSLRDIYLKDVDLNDGITISSGSRNQEGESNETKDKGRSRGRSRRSAAEYDSVETTLNTITELKDIIIEMADISDITERMIGKVYFDYGSSLNPDNMDLEIEKYLLISKQSEEKREYSSIVLGLNDLLSKVPAEKKDSAVFILMGYADTTLFNAIPEVSDRSEKFNTQLSLNRAETIKKILAGNSFGISPDKIIVQGLGYSKNIDATKDLWKYRRVDIVVSYE